MIQWFGTLWILPELWFQFCLPEHKTRQNKQPYSSCPLKIQFHQFHLKPPTGICSKLLFCLLDITQTNSMNTWILQKSHSGSLTLSKQIRWLHGPYQKSLSGSLTLHKPILWLRRLHQNSFSGSLRLPKFILWLCWPHQNYLSGNLTLCKPILWLHKPYLKSLPGSLTLGKPILWLRQGGTV